MIDLDNLEDIKKLDRGNALESIRQLADQCKQAWNEASFISFPDSYYSIKNIVIVGMGGSAYGGRMVKSLWDGAEYTKVPIELANNYWLPGYVGKDTLIILSSYSGTTEETLNCAKEAQKKGAKITGITSGGSLGDFLTQNMYPSYIFDPKFNPSKQPRIGVGYMVIGLVALLAKLKRVPVGDEEVKTLIEYLKRSDKTNQAKQLAQKLVGKIPVIIVADFLEGAAHAIRNPFHETAKQLGLYFVVPELNHHLLEGLQFPAENKSLLTFIFVESDWYDDRNKKRIKLTQEVVLKNNITIETIRLEKTSMLTQSMELIQLGAWVTFYLAMLNGVDPSLIPWVDYFKTQLKKPS